MSKISLMTELAEVPATTDEVVVLDKSDTTMSAAGTNKRNSRSNFLGYTEYVALLTQAGTDVPTATVIKNDTGATVTWSYVGVGSYLATFSSAVLTANKAIANICVNWQLMQMSANVASTATVTVNTASASGAAGNDRLVATPVIIRIYV